MASIDSRYVEKLQDFTKALEGIVELLKEDIQKNNVDNVNRLLSNMNDDLKGVVKNMEIVLKTTKNIESQNDKILQEVQAARKAKETGMFGEISDVDNKRKILDAVKVIVLIAAGVLAIGLAFKMISPVNFLSIIAIGLSIVFIAGAFVLVSAATDNMNTGDILKTSGLLVIMAMSLAVSSWILALASTMTLAKSVSIIFIATTLGTSLVLMSLFIQKAKLEQKDYSKMLLLPIVLPLISLGLAISSAILSSIIPLTLPQAMTAVFVAGAMGLSLYLIAQSLDKTKIEKKHIGQFLLLPLIIPALALSLVGASLLLSLIQPISFNQMISAIFTAATIGVLVYLMKPMIEKLQDINLQQVGLASLLILSLSAGLVGASYILSYMKLMGVKESLLLIMNSFAIGLSILFLLPSIYLLKSIETRQMLTAAGNIVILAGSIMASSWLLSAGSYDNVPDWQWAIGAGLSFIAFAGTIWLFDKMNLNGKKVLEGGLILLGISAVIMATSWILGVGNYENYPNLNWSIGVGLSLVAFGTGMMILGFIINSSGGVGAGALLSGSLATLGVATTIMLTSWILSIGNYDTYPDFEWSSGVGLSLIAFGTGMMILGGLIIATGGLAAGALMIGVLASIIVAGSIAASSWIISMGNYDTYPDIDWSSGVGLSLLAFSVPMLILGFMGPLALLAIGIGSLSMILLSGSIVSISKILSGGDYKSGPDINWATSTGSLLLSVGLSSVIFAGLLPFILLGGFSMKKIANTIVEISDILSKGDYKGGPSEEWSKGVGLSIKSFAEGISLLNSTGGILGRIFGTDQTEQIKKIAKAMVDASLILQEGKWESYPPSEWSNGVGNSVLSFAKAISVLDDADIDDGDEFIEIVRLISRGLIESAKILNTFNWSEIKNYPTEEWANGVGLAINAFAEPLSNMAEFDITGRDITRGIKKLSYGLIEAAEIINKYNWSSLNNNYPNIEWVNGVGKSLELFVKNLIDIENNGIGRSDLRILSLTIGAIIKTAKSFDKIDDNIWKKGPNSVWADNIGKSLETFVKYLIEIEKGDIKKGEIKNLNSVVDSIIKTVKSFSKIDDESWKKGPTKTWADNMGKALETFVKYLIEIEKNDISRNELKTLNKTVDSMIKIAIKFDFIQKLFPDIWESYPSGDWSSNIEKSISSFVNMSKLLKDVDDMNLIEKASNSMISFMLKLQKVLNNKEIYSNGGLFDTFSESMKRLSEGFSNTKAMSDGLNALGDVLLKISSIGTTTGDSIRNLTKSIIEMSNSLKTVDMGSMDKLSKFSNGILVLSLIDEKKFEDALRVLDKNRKDIISILSDNNTVYSKTPVGGETTIEDTMKREDENNSREKFYSDLLLHVSRLDSNVGKILEKQLSPEIKQEETQPVISKPVKTTDK